MSRHLLSLSSEMIDYQVKHSLGDELLTVFAAIEKYYNTAKPHDLISSLKNLVDGEANITKKEVKSFDTRVADIIKKHTNLKVSVDLYSHIAGAILVFPFNRNHIFLKDYFRDRYYLKDEKKILKESIGMKGSVDLSEGKVYGIFSTYEHLLHLNLNTFFVTYSLTAEEVVAVILHEIGHAFTWYEYSNRLASTNQLLSNLQYDTENNVTDLKTRTYIFKDVGRILDLSDKEVNELSNTLDNTILGSRLFKLYVKEIKSLRDHIKYDETSSEMLADNYAVRQGYAKPLVMALDKFYKYLPEKNNFALLFILTAEFMIDFIIIPALIITNLIAFPALGIFLAIYFTIYFFATGNISFKDMTYDMLKDRYNRIRMAQIGYLKNMDLPRDTVSEIIASLDEIGTIMNDTNTPVTLKEKLVSLILPGTRSTIKDISRQQDLEELGYNPLFIESSKLKHNL